MKIITLDSCNEFIAGDKCFIREMFNPLKEKLDLNYSLAYARVKGGEKTQKHRLSASEVYYIISGRGFMHINDETAEVKQNDTVYIPPHALQWIENPEKEDLEFLCIVEPAWQPDMEQILP